MPLREVEAALVAWREADRRLSEADGHSTEDLRREVERLRQEFQRLSADHMTNRIDALREAERQRATAIPSTPPFHSAAKREEEIAAEIWDVARQSDEDTPGAPLRRPALAAARILPAPHEAAQRREGRRP